MTTKCCKTCLSDKPLTGFARGKGSHNVRAHCKECMNTRWRAEHEKPETTHKYCPQCGENKLLEEFPLTWNSRHRRYYHTARCRPCRNAIATARRAPLRKGPRTSKQCKDCKEIKPIAEFPLRKKKTYTYRDSRCQPCSLVAKREENRRTQARLAHSKPGRRVALKDSKACTICSTVFHKRANEHLGSWNERRFCSNACWHEYRIERPHENPHWRGGFGPRNYGHNWPKQARLARKRDNYTCQDCGNEQTFPALDVHHLTPRWDYGEDYIAANDLRNLITLCKSCHTSRENALDKAFFGEAEEQSVA